jgi:hypothetical protein
MRRAGMSDQEIVNERYRIEIALAVIAAAATLATFFFDKQKLEDAVIIDAVVATLLLCVGSIKAHASRVAKVLIKAERRTGAKTAQIARILESLGGDDFRHASEVVDSALERLERARDGFITLDPSTYFKWLIDEMNKTPGRSRVLAVSSISALRWTEDPREAKYLYANIEARKRQVEINRIFLIHRPEMDGQTGEKIKQIVQHQRANGIAIGVVWDSVVPPELQEDFVLFEASDIAYRDEHDPHDPTRILKGERISNQHRLAEYRSNFQKLLLSCMDQAEMHDFFRVKDAGAA